MPTAPRERGIKNVNAADMMNTQNALKAAELMHLLAFARDLFQTDQVGDAFSLIGKTLWDLLHTDGGILVLKSHGVENEFAFGKAGQLETLDKGSARYRHALQSMTEDSIKDLVTHDGSSIVVPFPHKEPSGSLLVYWNHTVSPETLAYFALILRHLTELAGAALGNLSLSASLKQVVDYQFQQLAQEKELHTSELLRRDDVEDEMRSLSMTDMMTGLRNRRGFFLQAENAYKGAKRHDAKSAVIFADVDKLKEVNDKQGHQAGDQLIRDCALVFHQSFRKADVVARLGGDEFVAFTMYDEKPEVILRRIRDHLAAFRLREPRPYFVSFSTGVVQCDPTSNLGIADYLLMADKAMYAQKRKRFRRDRHGDDL